MAQQTSGLVTNNDETTPTKPLLKQRVKQCAMWASALIAVWLAAGFLMRHQAVNLMESRALHRAERCVMWAQRLRPWDDELLLFLARMARWRGDFSAGNGPFETTEFSAREAESWRLETKLSLIAQGRQRIDLAQCRRLMAERSVDVVETFSAVDVAEAFVVGFIKQGELGLATEILDVWESDEPSSAQVAYLRGTVALAAREQQAARRAWEKAIVREPRHELARQSLIELLIVEDQLTEALQHSTLQLKHTNGSPSSIVITARCLRLLGRPTEALACLNDLLDSSQRSAEWCLERGHIAFEFGDYANATSWFEKTELTSLSPVPTLQTTATVFALANQPDRAQQYFQWSSESLLAEGRRRELRLRQNLGIAHE